jgi:hypothetical protein
MKIFATTLWKSCLAMAVAAMLLGACTIVVPAHNSLSKVTDFHDWKIDQSLIMLQKNGVTYQYLFWGEVIPTGAQPGVEHWLTFDVSQMGSKTETISYNPSEAILEVDGQPIKPLPQYWYGPGNQAQNVASGKPIGMRGQVQVTQLEMALSQFTVTLFPAPLSQHFGFSLRQLEIENDRNCNEK